MPINTAILNKKIDVRQNEKEVLKLLKDNGVPEINSITSPAKKVWFKNYHYIRVVVVESVGYAYKYVTYKTKQNCQNLPNITFDEFKEYLQ